MTAVWTAPELTGLGRLPMHSVPHDDRLDLDGRRRFQLLEAPNPEPTAEWGETDVPSLWTRAGTWDLPHCTSVQVPFQGLPPAVPEHNPTGIDKRDLELPAGCAGREPEFELEAARVD